VPTASWGYLRLRKTTYGDDELKEWATRIESQPWDEAFAFLKHEEHSPAGPEAATKLLGMV
jgi:hypothetical protein